MTKKVARSLANPDIAVELVYQVAVSIDRGQLAASTGLISTNWDR